MQKNNMALKRRIEYDGEEVPGLTETSELKDEEGVVEVPSFDRVFTIKNGVKKFEPLNLVYKIARDTNTQQFFSDWYFNNEYHDMVIIETDATGAEVNRWLCRDCECKLFSKRTYNAGGVEFHGVNVIITCTTTPVPQYSV